VAITAELIAFRRHAKAKLPHMSWFQTKELSDAPENSKSHACCDEQE
jgi:hypothetical protein